MTGRLIALTSVIFFFFVFFVSFFSANFSSVSSVSTVQRQALRYLYLLCFRVISRAPGLKLVVETLMSSLKPIGNIVVICCAFFIIFGILGVQVSCGKEGHRKKKKSPRLQSDLVLLTSSESDSIC